MTGDGFHRGQGEWSCSTNRFTDTSACSSAAARPPPAGETDSGGTGSSCSLRLRSTVRLVTGNTRSGATAAAPPAAVPRLPHPQLSSSSRRDRGYDYASLVSSPAEVPKP